MSLDKSDIELWKKMLQGDQDAFAKIYSHFVRNLYVYGLKFTSKQDVVEDCIHDLFTDLLNKSKSIKNTDQIEYYLIKAFRNNLLRQLKREQKYMVGESVEYEFDVHFPVEEEIIEQEEVNRKKQMLAKELNLLSGRQKEAIYLRYTKGMEYDEIAEIMDMEVESCRNIIYRAIKSLRNRLTDQSALLLLLAGKWR
ncbi:sigma-70 family RNA polymerase sigma factor [Puteibacter caeruleilacunae]|nr:sigma-70 family RNA polymerase sigma factor [Puteibacter caeruleilacunae]